MDNKMTIRDVACLAGVSKAPVSRVLNTHSSVNALLRERVQRVVQEYDFVPSVTAIGLAGGYTRLIGVLAPPLIWPSVPKIMHSVAKCVERTNYETVFYSTSFERNHSDVLDVPEDIAIVGFDDNNFSAHMRPSLTTIWQLFSEMGRKALELLISMMNQNQGSEKGSQQRSMQQNARHSSKNVQESASLRIRVPIA